MLTLFVRAMQAQMAAQMSGSANATAASGLDTFALIRILMSRDSAAEFKKALAKTFDQMESLTAAMEGDEWVGDSQRTQRGGGEERSRKCSPTRNSAALPCFTAARTCRASRLR